MIFQVNIIAKISARFTTEDIIDFLDQKVFISNNSYILSCSRNEQVNFVENLHN